MVVASSILLFFLILFTLWNGISMPKLKGKHTDGRLVSVLVPMRDEEKNVPGLISSLKTITYENVEIILLDDGSSDCTNHVASELIKDDQRFTLIKGIQLPEGWVGKVHACHLLSKEAKGDFCFLDADVRISKSVIEECFYLMKKYQSALISGFAHFPTKPILAKLLVPFQHYFVFGLLPVHFANHTTWKNFTAAHGGFMFFNRNVYEQVGGHESVKENLVEDITFAKRLKKFGYRVTLANISNKVTCNMYSTNKDVWQGFLKNIYLGMGKNPFVVIGFTLFYSLLYVVPVPLFIIGLITKSVDFLVPLCLVFIQSILIDRFTKGEFLHFLLTPIATICMLILLWSSMIKNVKGKAYEWKGRNYI
ncbi:hypothetical protein Q75_07990 [Bacillus coahuilensis p1.1.43]|uniref:Glycosyltransferase 2-like domain-containing protein n=1 Tax=Bacillus coahuilensis p1.1.43 TaxID=1150625 RepID=A0A147K8M1_9BACI|nr:glycosyltransferase [Bacillus coahuilensis]KUP06465.1 hypothetical protein Q75_07990 [Bacillus coahuilensis p1.1.43]